MTYKDKGSYESSPPCMMNVYGVITMMNVYGMQDTLIAQKQKNEMYMGCKKKECLAVHEIYDDTLCYHYDEYIWHARHT